MVEYTNDPEHTAVHEAGHAVIARVLDMACGGATIVADEDEGSAGNAETFDPHVTAHAWDRRGHFRDMRSVFVGRILTVMAGAEAEEELLGSCEGGDGGDRDQVALMLQAICDEAAEDRLEARLRRMTKMLCRRHRAAIGAVADALLASGTLQSEVIWSVSKVKRPPDIDYWAEAFGEA